MRRRSVLETQCGSVVQCLNWCRANNVGRLRPDDTKRCCADDLLHRSNNTLYDRRITSLSRLQPIVMAGRRLAGYTIARKRICCWHVKSLRRPHNPLASPAGMKWQASVARCLPNPALKVLSFQGLDLSLRTGLGSQCLRLSIVVICNYHSDPITVVSCRAKTRPLHPRRSYFAPAETHLCCAAGATRHGNDSGLWWRRRVLPPGPMSLLRRPFIAIVERIRHR